MSQESFSRIRILRFAKPYTQVNRQFKAWQPRIVQSFRRMGHQLPEDCILRVKRISIDLADGQNFRRSAGNKRRFEPV